MSEKLTVLVDMDGVVADSEAEVARRFTERYPDTPLTAPRRSLYIEHDHPEHSDILRDISAERGFFRALPVVRYALEGWQRMLDYGYTPRFCTSPYSLNPTCDEDKLAWIEQIFVPHFGQDVLEEAIIAKDKYLVAGIAIIDDHNAIPNAEKASWQQITFDQPYNRQVPGPRLFGWLDDNLEALLASVAVQYPERYMAAQLARAVGKQVIN